MTPEHVLNHVAYHLLEQSRRSVAPVFGQVCCLIGDDGDRCAIGWTLPDSAKAVVIGGGLNQSSIPLLLSDPVLQESHPAYVDFLREHHDLLTQLQSTHDVRKISTWESDFRTLAVQAGIPFAPRCYRDELPGVLTPSVRARS